MASYLSKLRAYPQKFVDGIGMYRLVTGSLGILAIFSVFAGYVGLISYSGNEQLVALVLALITALLLNSVIGFITKIPVNNESAVITALILFFLVIPGATIQDNWPLVSAVALAIFSKYLLVWRKQHIVNAAALGAVALSLTGVYVFSWWVSNPVLFVPILVLGSLVVMKVRKWELVLAFILTGLAVYVFESYRFGEVLSVSVQTYFLSWPTLFLAFFMLTEPFTMPATKRAQICYGATVGILLNTSLFIPLQGYFVMTPELALVLGNIAFYPARLRQKLFLTLERKVLIAKDTWEFIFEKPKGFTFQAGQYLEWMLPHKKNDSRGIRRYFTIASSPTEPDVKVAMKITTGGSSYKAALETLDTGGKVIASQLAGDFVLPKDTTKKLAFIAGGIGITPFRSHIQYMKDSGLSHDTVLYFCNKTHSEVVYQDLFEVAAASFPLEVIQVIQTEQYPSPYEYGYVTSEMVKRRTPDYLERHWYISGPPGMVNAYATLLKRLGVASKHITKDFFPGLA